MSRSILRSNKPLPKRIVFSTWKLKDAYGCGVSKLSGSTSRIQKKIPFMNSLVSVRLRSSSVLVVRWWYAVSADVSYTVVISGNPFF